MSGKGVGVLFTLQVYKTYVFTNTYTHTGLQRVKLYLLMNPRHVDILFMLRIIRILEKTAGRNLVAMVTSSQITLIDHIK